MYADDTVLYTHGKSATEVATKLSKVMNKVSDCLYNSCLMLNVDKTVTMFFTNRCKLIIYPEIVVNEQKIKNVEQLKNLGVTLDPTISFKGHVFSFYNGCALHEARVREIVNCRTPECRAAGKMGI